MLPVSTFADPHKQPLAAARVLLRNQPHPCSKVVAVLELTTVAHGRNNCCRRLWTYTIDPGDPCSVATATAIPRR